MGAQANSSKEIVSWKSSLASIDVGEVIVLDFPAQSLIRVLQVLAASNVQGLSKPICWEGASPSRSNTKFEPRMSIRVSCPVRA